jgi:hypothetical protein
MSEGFIMSDGFIMSEGLADPASVLGMQLLGE